MLTAILYMMHCAFILHVRIPHQKNIGQVTGNTLNTTLQRMQRPVCVTAKRKERRKAKEKTRKETRKAPCVVVPTTLLIQFEILENRMDMFSQCLRIFSPIRFRKCLRPRMLVRCIQTGRACSGHKPGCQE